jgi:hypothetical protein
MVVALAALFLSLGGVGYAASNLPAGSVGTAQLQHSSVTHSKLRFGSVSYQDIQPEAVGRVRANLNQLQARVSGTCPSGTAIGTVQNNGQVNCNQALPSQFGTTSNSNGVTAKPTTVTSETLPAGSSYLAFANPTAAVTGNGTAQRVTVSCTLTVGSNTQTRNATIDTGSSTITANTSIPLQLEGTAGTSSVSCSSTSTGTPAASVSVTSALNALQVATSASSTS